MIVYMRCICTSRDKQLAKKLRAEGYEVRVMRGNPDIRKEAMQYQRTPPFIVERGKSRPV